MTKDTFINEMAQTHFNSMANLFYFITIAAILLSDSAFSP